ncbi:MAG: hypothetical protein Q9226_004620 [Calogaya cf. arnoldii]
MNIKYACIPNYPKKLPLTVILRVRTLTGKEIELDIEPDYKVSRIKERVEEKEGIPPVQQRLIFGGKQMYVLCIGGSQSRSMD